MNRSSMLIDVNELKGIDFSTKYVNPSKIYCIENEDFEFKSQAMSSKRYEYRISCIKELFFDFDFDVGKLYDELTINLKFNINRAIFFKNGIKTRNKKLLTSPQHFMGRFCDETNENHVKDFGKKLSKYVNVENADIKNLMLDLKSPDSFSKFENCAYSLILKEFKLDLDKIQDLKYIIRSKMILNNDDKLFSREYCDFSDESSLGFKLSYIKYLQLVNSVHDNYMDSNHYFDNDGEVSPYVYFYENYEYFAIDFLKNLALSENHIVDGEGVGILKFKTKVSHIKKVLGNHGLKKSGSKDDLINRILDNLSIDEINNEFNGSRFILTDNGKNLLNKYYYYNFEYFKALPFNFDVADLIKLYNLNKEYQLEDILFILLMHDWIIIDDSSSFSQNMLKRLISKFNSKRYHLADILKNEFPEKSIELYLKGIHSQFNLHYAEKLCKLYQKNDDYYSERKFIQDLIENFNFEINFDQINDFHQKEIKNDIDSIIQFINDLLSDDALKDFERDLNDIKSIILKLNPPNEMKTEEYILLRRNFFTHIEQMVKILYERKDYSSVEKINGLWTKSKINLEELFNNLENNFSYYCMGDLTLREYSWLDNKLRKIDNLQ